MNSTTQLTPLPSTIPQDIRKQLQKQRKEGLDVWVLYRLIKQKPYGCDYSADDSECRLWMCFSKKTDGRQVTLNQYEEWTHPNQPPSPVNHTIYGLKWKLDYGQKQWNELVEDKGWVRVA